VEKQAHMSSPIAIKNRETSVSPVSSPIEGQLHTMQSETLQPVAESPEERELDELSVSTSSSSSTSPTVKGELD
jgi:hypothetical protein